MGAAPGLESRAFRRRKEFASIDPEILTISGVIAVTGGFGN
jgi:hypothetical protein